MRIVIQSGQIPGLSFRELVHFGGLLRYLSLRDVFVRYKQTWLGFGWSLIRPAINILIFGTLSYLVDRGGGFTSKFVTVSAGIVFWQLISTLTTDVSNALSANAGILTKVYFPKILLPISSLLVGLVDFAIAFVLFLLIYLGFHGLPGPEVALLPVFVFAGMVISFSIGLIAATASVKYRDIKFIVPFMLQILFYASPVFISSNFILSHHLPDWLKVVYQLNPFVFIINGFRYCLFGTFENFDPVFSAISMALILVLLIVSVRYFVKFERTFADFI